MFIKFLPEMYSIFGQKSPCYISAVIRIRSPEAHSRFAQEPPWRSSALSEFSFYYVNCFSCRTTDVWYLTEIGLLENSWRNHGCCSRLEAGRVSAQPCCLPGNRLSSLFESGSLIIRKIGAFRRRRPLTRYSWKEWGAGGVSEGGWQAGRTAAVLRPSLQAMCTCHRLTRPPPSGIKSQPEELAGPARPGQSSLIRSLTGQMVHIRRPV